MLGSIGYKTERLFKTEREITFAFQNFVGCYHYSYFVEEGEESRSTRRKTPDDQSDNGSSHLQESFHLSRGRDSNPRPAVVTAWLEG